MNDYLYHSHHYRPLRPNLYLSTRKVINPLVKIVLRPVIAGILALLDQVATQITNGEKEKALATITDLKKAIEAAQNYLK